MRDTEEDFSRTETYLQAILWYSQAPPANTLNLYYHLNGLHTIHYELKDKFKLPVQHIDIYNGVCWKPTREHVFFSLQEITGI